MYALSLQNWSQNAGMLSHADHYSIFTYLMFFISHMKHNFALARKELCAGKAGPLFTSGTCIYQPGKYMYLGVQWLGGRVLNSRLKGCRLETHWRHCIVSLKKTH